MNTIIRDAKESDLELVATYPNTKEELFYIYPSAKFPLTKDQLMMNFTSREGNTVIEKDGAAVAYANYISVESGGSAVIGNVVVNPSLRSNGLGELIINHMVELAVTKYQASKAVIPCFNTNKAGLRFYERIGFSFERSEQREDLNGNAVLLNYLSRPINA